jgi:transcriptional antiterminator RfaH
MSAHPGPSVSSHQPASPPPIANVNWFCLHTRPQKEAHVESYCRETLGIETYFPRLKEHRTIRRVRRVVTSPLFPRYLFCRIDLANSYRAIRYAPEVISLVHAGDAPAVVSDALIEELKGWAGYEIDRTTLMPSFRPGDAVQVVQGPMQGVSAVILRASDEQDRVTILLSLLQCGAQLTISRAQLERVSAVA